MNDKILMDEPMIRQDTARRIFLPAISVKTRETTPPTSSATPPIIAAIFGSNVVEALANISTV